MAIATYNSRGVALLLTGDNEEAIKNFRRSLTILQSQVNQLSDCEAENSSNECRDQQSGVGHEEPSPIFSSSMKLVGLQREASAFVYSRPLVFTCHLSSSDLDCSLHLYCAMLLFNMALAFHQGSKMTGREILRIKAITLYGICLEILPMCEKKNRISILIASAVLNNKSQLHFEAGDDEKARCGMEQLSNLLFSKGCSDVLAVYGDDALNGFVFNISLWKPGNVATAA